MCDWYTENIEEGIRSAVRLLRNNGINTTGSCHHSMTIYAESYHPKDVDKVDSILLHHGYSYYEITLTWTRRHNSIDGALVQRLKITFLKCPECRGNHIVNIAGLVAHKVGVEWPHLVDTVVEEIKQIEDVQKRKKAVQTLLGWMSIFASKVEKPELIISIWRN